MRVCLELKTSTDFAVVLLGKSVASDLFRGIGVAMRWSCEEVENERPPILVEVEGWVPHDFHPGALGYANLNGIDKPPSAVVLFERVEMAMNDEPAMRGVLFGYVLAHEVGHVLSGVPDHTAGGVMRARWSEEDLYRILSRRMKLTADDARLMGRNQPPMNANQRR